MSFRGDGSLAWGKASHFSCLGAVASAHLRQGHPPLCVPCPWFLLNPPVCTELSVPGEASPGLGAPPTLPPALLPWVLPRDQGSLGIGTQLLWVFTADAWRSGRLLPPAVLVSAHGTVSAHRGS